MGFPNPIQKTHLQVKIDKSSKTFIMNVLSKWGFDIWRKIEPNKSEKIRNEKTWAYPWTFLRVWLNLESRLVRVLSFFLGSSGLLLLLFVGVPHGCCYAKTMLSISVLCFYLLVHILVFSYDQRIRKTHQHAVVIIKKKKTPAHLLAKYAKGIVHQCTWMQSCPSFLKLAILHDVNFIVIWLILCVCFPIKKKKKRAKDILDFNNDFLFIYIKRI